MIRIQFTALLKPLWKHYHLKDDYNMNMFVEVKPTKSAGFYIHCI